MKPRVLALSLVLCAALLSACGSSSSSTTSTARKVVPPTYGTADITYDEPANKTETLAKEVYSDGQTLQIAKNMMGNFKLPNDIHLAVKRGFIGPNWQPADRTITLSYGFMDYMAAIVRRGNPKISDYDLGRELAALNGFILIHEMGHMLVNQLSLPITGKEEDAVDELAAVFMLKFVKHGDEFSFDAAQFFHDLSSDRGAQKESDYWDTHSLDEQRAYNIVCWIAGSNQADYKVIQSKGILGEDRLQGCPAEFQQKVNSWLTLLKPYFRKPAATPATTTPTS